MGFLHKAVSTLFYPAVAAGKVVSAGGKKVESSIERLINDIVIFFQTSAGILLLGGVTAVLILAKNPKAALLLL